MLNFMKSLDEELGIVNALSLDLEAEKVIQEEEGHYCNRVGYGGRGGYTWDKEFIEKEIYLIDKGRITLPDNRRRDNARKELENIHSSSKYFKVRYAAGEILNKRYLQSDFEREFNNILKDYLNGSDEVKRIAEEDLAMLYTIAPSKELRKKIGHASGLDDIIILSDEVMRYYTYQHLTKEELKRIYNSKEKDIPSEAIIRAGMALQYGTLMIFFHLFKRKFS